MIRAALLTSIFLAAPLLSGCHRARHVPGEPCTYPTSGFGIEEGDAVVKQAWPGYAEHSNTQATIGTEDYLDCDGSKGINAVLIETSASWCGPCQEAASRVQSEMKSGWQAAGIHVLTLMAQDASGGPATVGTAFAWKSQFNLDSTAVAADPAYSFAPPFETTIALPLEVVVDPRTMTIVETRAGYTGDYGALTDLASDNQGD